MKSRRWYILAVLALVQFTIVADTTIVNIALPDIAHDLALSEVRLTWVVNAYLLTAGGLLLLGGRVGDLIGRRRAFLLGAAAFGIASACCALAVDGRMLIAARAVQGVGEALASPAALSLIATLFPSGPERAKALGIWAGLAGLGAVVGVTLSGTLVTFFGWPSIFWINVPVVLCSILLIFRLLPADRARGTGPVDLVGSLLLTGGSLAGLHALTLVPQHGHSLILTVATGATSVVLLGGFLLRQRLAPFPLIPRGFFTHRTRAVANALSMLVVGPMAALFLILTLYQQDDLGRSPLETGLSYLPFCLAFLGGIAAGVTSISRWGETTTAALAFALAGVGSMILGFGLPVSNFGLMSLPGMIPLALGFGMAMPALQNAAMVDLSEDTVGLGAGVQTTSQALGNALGVASAMVTSLMARDLLEPTRSWPHGRLGAAIAIGAGGLVLILGLTLTLLALRMPRGAAGRERSRQPNQQTTRP